MVYTRYIPCLNFLGFPDATRSRMGTVTASWVFKFNLKFRGRRRRPPEHESQWHYGHSGWHGHTGR